MGKSHAADWVSDAPTPAQLAEFFAQIKAGPGRISRTRLQAFLRNEPPPETVWVSGAYPTTVWRGSGAITTHLHSSRSNLRLRDPRINTTNFPQGNASEPWQMPVHLLYFGRDIGTEEVLCEIDRLGFVAARPTHLLGLANGHPSLFVTRTFPCVVALGQFFLGSETSQGPEEKLACCLTRETKEETIEVWAIGERAWATDPEVRFAVVPKRAEGLTPY